MRSFALALEIALAIALASSWSLGCSASDSGSDSGAEEGSGASSSGGGAGTIEEASALFARSSADPSLVEFKTKDPAYITDRGYTLWTIGLAAQAPFRSRTVVLNKASGSAEAGYGLVFCHRASEERMLVVMIDAQQEYIVGEALGSSFVPILPWTASEYLKKGYNQDNEIGLRLNSSTRIFTLAINGVDVKSFSAIEPDYELGGGNGYLVVISPWDRFPELPVAVSFREE